jgi:hypothetical protein
MRGGEDKNYPFNHFKLVTLQFNHCNQDFGGEKHHVLL